MRGSIGTIHMIIEPIFSDIEILVINKPAGIPVLPDGWDPNAPYLVDILEKEYGKLWVVHRLDKITSGVMVFTKTSEAHRILSIQFEHHEVQKKYRAICCNEPPWEEHTAKHPLRIDVGHNHRSVVDNGKGMPAETHFRILKRYKRYCLIEALPRTGRTHQIRVHAYALGIPLLGDRLYNAPETKLISRPALHSNSLTFTHPESRERVTFCAEYPEDFSSALKAIEAAKEE
jgi:RluA family pseudouridine synthase